MSRAERMQRKSMSRGSVFRTNKRRITTKTINYDALQDGVYIIALLYIPFEPWQLYSVSTSTVSACIAHQDCRVEACLQLCI